jgi:DNA-binding transcriptional ArsR family regulator
MTETDIDRVFHALSDSTRRDILRRAIGREQSVSAMARQYAMSFAAVQKHVAVLESAALVCKDRLGREQIVHANPARLHAAAELLDAFEQLWVHRANQIADILTGTEGEPT